MRTTARQFDIQQDAPLCDGTGVPNQPPDSRIPLMTNSGPLSHPAVSGRVELALPACLTHLPRRLPAILSHPCPLPATVGRAARPSHQSATAPPCLPATLSHPCPIPQWSGRAARLSHPSATAPPCRRLRSASSFMCRALSTCWRHGSGPEHESRQTWQKKLRPGPAPGVSPPAGDGGQNARGGDAGPPGRILRAGDGREVRGGKGREVRGG